MSDPLQPKLRRIVDTLLANSEDRREVTLDEVGDAFGTESASVDDVDQVLATLEHAGRKIIAPSVASGVESLKKMIPAVRSLREDLLRQPTVDEIAARSGLTRGEIQHAMLLAKVMGRDMPKA